MDRIRKTEAYESKWSGHIGVPLGQATPEEGIPWSVSGMEVIHVRMCRSYCTSHLSVPVMEVTK